MALGLNDFYAGKFITRAIGRGWALKISTFLGPKKSKFPGPTPCQMPLVIDVARLKTNHYRTYRAV
jgi:hypothetical protein